MSLPPIFNRLRLPVIGAPLFIISNPNLVIAQCMAGIVGSFPALNARPEPVLEDWLMRVTDALAAYDEAHPDAPSAPFAVNQIVHKSNDRLMRDLELCVKYRVPIVITSLGARPEVNEAVHSYGGIVLHDVISPAFARKALEKGADGLIAVAAGAGGHAGTLSPFALLAEIRSFFDGPLALSGAISTGGAILAAQAAGADLAYIGSAFIATEEANAADGYKRAVIESSAEDIVYSNLFTGVHGNYLRSSIVAAGLDPAALPQSDATKMNFGSSSTKAWRDIWGAGQGVGSVRHITTAAQRVAQWQEEYRAARIHIMGN
jgi:nitronate monooxygenase